ncbi:hypothetical protein ACEN2A_01765 [Corynebacterium auriscanis]|uniref:hypothetical protein n=1 Tax=Corynebacterium auriscanis TaxID=99807 RepID=UPI003CE86662
MTNFIDELKEIGTAVQKLHSAANAMDNLATLDEWRGNSHENIRNLFIALAEAASITSHTLLGDMGDGKRVNDKKYLHILAEAAGMLASFYSAAALDAAKATNYGVLKERFGKLNDLDDTWHYSAHKDLCYAVGVYQQLEANLSVAEFRARREFRVKENYRESALKAEKRAEDLEKENRALRKLIAGGDQP